MPYKALQYAISETAYEALLDYKVAPKKFIRKPYLSQEWDGSNTILSNVPLSVSRSALINQGSVQIVDITPRLSVGISKGLIKLSETTPIEAWVDTRPFEQDNSQTPPQLISTHAAAREYIHNVGTPTYANIFFDYDAYHDIYGKDPNTGKRVIMSRNHHRYKLSLSPRAREYFAELFSRFKMQPLHQGGRDLTTTRISTVLEAIGIHYIEPLIVDETIDTTMLDTLTDTTDDATLPKPPAKRSHYKVNQDPTRYLNPTRQR